MNPVAVVAADLTAASAQPPPRPPRRLCQLAQSVGEHPSPLHPLLLQLQLLLLLSWTMIRREGGQGDAARAAPPDRRGLLPLSLPQHGGFSMLRLPHLCRRRRRPRSRPLPSRPVEASSTVVGEMRAGWTGSLWHHSRGRPVGRSAPHSCSPPPTLHAGRSAGVCGETTLRCASSVGRLTETSPRDRPDVWGCLPRLWRGTGGVAACSAGPRRQAQRQQRQGEEMCRSCCGCCCCGCGRHACCRLLLVRAEARTPSACAAPACANSRQRRRGRAGR